MATVRGGAADKGAALHGSSCNEDWCKSARAVGPSKETTAAGLVSLAADVSPLVSSFNAAKGRPRFLAILSPTCGACVHGAEAIKAAVLPLGPSVDMWKNDYAATPVEGNLVDELRSLMAGARRAAAIR